MMNLYQFRVLVQTYKNDKSKLISLKDEIDNRMSEVNELIINGFNATTVEEHLQRYQKLKVQIDNHLADLELLGDNSDPTDPNVLS